MNDWKSRKKIIAKTLQICAFPAKKVSINFLCFFWLQAFQKFISHYNLMIESQWKQIVANTFSNLGNPCENVLDLFFMFFLVTDFSNYNFTLQLNDWKSGKQIISKTLQIWASKVLKVRNFFSSGYRLSKKLSHVSVVQFNEVQKLN